MKTAFQVTTESVTASPQCLSVCTTISCEHNSNNSQWIWIRFSKIWFSSCDPRHTVKALQFTAASCKKVYIDWIVFYAAFNSISVISRQQLTLFMSFLGFTSTRLGLWNVWHKDTPAKNSEDPVRLEPRTPGLRVKHFTTQLRRTPLQRGVFMFYFIFHQFLFISWIYLIRFGGYFHGSCNQTHTVSFQIYCCLGKLCLFVIYSCVMEKAVFMLYFIFHQFHFKHWTYLHGFGGKFHRSCNLAHTVRVLEFIAVSHMEKKRGPQNRPHQYFQCFDYHWWFPVLYSNTCWKEQIIRERSKLSISVLAGKKNTQLLVYCLKVPNIVLDLVIFSIWLKDCFQYQNK